MNELSQSLAMSSGLPIPLEDLIHARSVEDNRREFKAVWNEVTRDAVVKTVCAFANDLLNLNGGYIVIGIETDDAGEPILPPRGLDNVDMDRLQREIRGRCNRISPSYQPILFPEIFQQKKVMVVWAPGGDNRPYEAPKDNGDREYFVRQGSQTVIARDELRLRLLGQAARVPFDDRRNLTESADKISEKLVAEFLTDVGSNIGREVPLDKNRVYANMRLVSPLNSHQAARNFALLFFTDDPNEIFPGARIEIVQFADDAGGNLIEERTIKGPLHHQIRQALVHLESLGDVLSEKTPRRAEVARAVTYPYEAIREAVVNAVYHRSYESTEPTKIYMYPDRMEVISYPGPVDGVELHHLAEGVFVPPVPARNRKIGELLKELRLAEARGTGLPKIRRRMRDNGSSQPLFDFDPGRTYFRVVLPVHPRYRTLHALREGTLMWATGNRRESLEHLIRASEEQPGSGAIAGQIIEYAASLGDLSLVTETFERFNSVSNKTEVSQPYLRYAEVMLDIEDSREARRALSLIPTPSGHNDLIEAAILNKRTGNYPEAHRIFESVYQETSDDPRVVQEFAQTKLALARATSPRDATKKTLNRQAAELLRRAIQLTDNPVRKAWCWYDLAGTLAWLREPRADIENAYLQAISLKEDERRFRESYNKWRRQDRR